MPILVVAVLLVGLLCLLDLLLTFGVLRRLKEHTAQLEQLLNGAGAADALPPVGMSVGEFTAATVDGGTVSLETLASGVETLVAFFSPDCEPCREKLPDFIEYARRSGTGRRVLTVVTGPVERGAAMAESLEPVSTVVVDGVDGPVRRAFRVTATPGFCLVDGAGRVAAADFDLDRIPALVQS